jgi:hypothetical protein
MGDSDQTLLKKNYIAGTLWLKLYQNDIRISDANKLAILKDIEQMEEKLGGQVVEGLLEYVEKLQKNPVGNLAEKELDLVLKVIFGPEAKLQKIL